MYTKFLHDLGDAWSYSVVRKRNRADIFSRLSTMHERDRQTEKLTDRPRNC